MTTPGCIELTWNYGSEKEEGKVYNTGNADATGTNDGEKVRGGQLYHTIILVFEKMLIL